MSAAGVKSFVRETLGCACPDAVFRSIETDTGGGELGGIPVLARLVIGARLLVYLLDADAVPGDALAERIPAALRAGRDARDQASLNRCRVVLVTGSPPAIEAAADRALTTLPEADDRLHLHTVHDAALPAF